MSIPMKIDENPYTTSTKRRTYLKDQSIFGAGHRGSNDQFQYDLRPLVYQETTSEGHPFFTKVKHSGAKGGVVDLGGPFSTLKIEGVYNRGPHSSQFPVNAGILGSQLWDFVGHPIDPNLPHSGYPPMFRPYNEAGIGNLANSTAFQNAVKQYSHSGSSEAELLAYGTQAVDRTRPNSTPVSLTQTMVELMRDGLPFRELVSERRWRGIYKDIQEHGLASTSSKQLSDVFLDHQFGLMPLLSDVGAAVKLVNRTDNVLDELKSDAAFGGTRVKYTFPDTHSRLTENYSRSFTPAGFGLESAWWNNYSNAAKWNHQTTMSTWFTGAWAVFMPEPGPAEDNLHALSERLRLDWGLDMNIETIWNLAPWSWLVDWEFNMGSVIKNFSHFSDQSVLLRYGYIMQTCKHVRTYERPGVTLKGDTNPSEPPLMQQVVSTYKRRRRATPYGFGKSFGSLSNLQKTILAAIGVTRF